MEIQCLPKLIYSENHNDIFNNSFISSRGQISLGGSYIVNISTHTFKVPTLQNGQTHSNNLPAVGDELFECV